MSTLEAEQPGQRQGPMGVTGLPLAIEQKLTPSEVTAMVKARGLTSTYRAVGGAVGGCLTFAYLFRKGRGIFTFRSFGSLVGGSFTGSLLALPFSLYSARRHLEGVEDPQHLKSVLAEAYRDFRREPAPTRGPTPLPQQGSAFPSNAQQQTQRMPDRRSSSQTNQWGDEVGQGQSSYPDPESFSEAQSSSSQYPQSYTSNSSSSSQQQQQPFSGGPGDATKEAEAPQSRWAQLRSQRGVQESSWEKIRQENARESYNRQASAGQGQPDQEAFSTTYSNQQESSGLADPDFGKGISPSRLQAQREYEKSFQREKRGIDG